MPLFKLNFKTILISFLVFNVLISFLLEHYGRIYPNTPCYTGAVKNSYYSMVSKDFWDALCENGNVFVSSSEGSGLDDFQNIFDTIYQIKFEAFSGQHRGLKTAAYLVSHDIHPDRLKKLKLIVLVNPVYWLNSYAEIDDGAAHQSALSYFSYAHRVHLGQHWLNIFGNMALTSKEYIQNYHPFQFKYLFSSASRLEASRAPQNSSFSEPDSYLDFADDSQNVKEEKLELRKNYDFQNGMTKEAFSKSNNVPFEWHFDAQVEPMSSILDFFKQRALSLNLQYCLVLLPLNEIYLRNGMKDLDSEKDTIRKHYIHFPQEKIVDLMDLGSEVFLFKDLMHFTRFGRHKISENLKNSKCFQNVFGS